MTDDFHLFAHPDDGEGPIDPDVALMCAYLARELSPMQVLALEDRLATDGAFRAAMQPLIDAWAAPVASLEGGRARQVAPLSTTEIAESWRRFQQEELTVIDDARVAHTASLGKPNTAIESTKHRRISMTRIAAMIGIVVLPMVTFAQYAATHVDAPGHALVQTLVAPFTRGAQPAPAKTPTTTGDDAPQARLSQLARATQEFTSPASTEELGAIQTPRRNPDRARIAALAKEHLPAVVRGDAGAEYIIMVLDAVDKYVWSTSGSGNVAIVVAGDTRTAAERGEYTREHRADYWGAAGADLGFLAAGIHDSAMSPGVHWLATPRSLVLHADSLRVRRFGTIDFTRDSTLITMRVRGDSGARGARGGGTGSVTWGQLSIMPESLRILHTGPDSLKVFHTRGGARGGSIVLDSLSTGAIAGRVAGSRLDVLVDALGGAVTAGNGARGGRGGGATTGADSTRPPGSYMSGWAGTRNGSSSNLAPGLQEPTAGQSGIQGLLAASVASTETYVFAPGELAPRSLQILVIHLTPGAVWKGR